MKNKQLDKTADIKTKGHDIEALYQRISKCLQSARKNVLRNIDTEMVSAYWNIGREVIEDEQKGSSRAIYGEEIIKKLSERLSHEFGKGYSVSNLRYMRQFYLVYQDQIRQTLSGELLFEPRLSWSRYCLLMKIGLKSAREFYEKEAIQPANF